MSEPTTLFEAMSELADLLDSDNSLAFAAARSERLTVADEEVAPYVQASLESGDWQPTVDAASQLWLEIYTGLAPDAYPQATLEDFQADLLAALEQTQLPEEEPEQAQLERVVKFVGTAAVNDATLQGTQAAGGRRMRWVTMHDDDVRAAHSAVDGQIRPVTQPFDVGGASLRYPGDPLGPLEQTINCRCLLAPVGRLARSSLMAAVPPTTDIDTTELDELVETDDVDTEALVDDDLEVPWHAVIAPEGTPTGDGRMFAEGSLDWRQLPLPLLYQHATGDGHGGSVRVGRIDEVWKTEDGQVRGRGVFNGTEDAQHVIGGIMDGSIRGVSVDADNLELDFDETLVDSDGGGYDGVLVFSKARVAGLTIVAIPAYQEAYIALGEAFEDELSEADLQTLAACGCDGELDLLPVTSFRDYSPEEREKMAGDGRALPDGSYPIADEEDLRNAIQAVGRAADPEAARAHIKKRAKALGLADLVPEDWALTAAVGTKDGPGWITNPRSTARLRRYWTHGRGAAKIRWGEPGDFNRCRKQLAKYVENPDWLAGTCANMHREALGLWPGMERGGRHTILTAVPAVALAAAGAPEVLPAEAFADPGLGGPTALTVTTPRVYGHLATWGVCHIGIQDVCTTAPHSLSGYAYFRTGAVQTDAGPIAVGQITMGTGHAALNQGASAAAAHYDNTGAVIADVAAGEDQYGIWVAGMLRPGVSEEQVAALQAAALSGDWRIIGGSLELVAALAVNVPGFPVPRVGLAASAGATRALVAAGVVPASGFGSTSDAERTAAIARTAVQEYMAELAAAAAAEERAARFAPIREEVRVRRAAALRERTR